MGRRTKNAKESGAATRRRAPWGLVAILALLLGALAPLWWSSRSRSGPRPASAVPVPDPVTTEFEPPVQEILAQARKAVLDDPTSMKAWGVYATVLDAHLLNAQAEFAYRRALELAPDDPALSYDLAILLEAQGADPEESLTLYRTFARAQPNFPPVHVRIGRIFVVQGRLEEAAKSLRTALQLDPKLTIARRTLGQVLLALDDAAGAKSELERVAAAAPKDGPTQAALAQAYTRLGDDARAAEAMRREKEGSETLSLPDPVQFLVTKQGRSARLASERATDRIRSADYAGAVEDLEIVLRTRASDPQIHDRLADAYQHLGETRLAEQQHAEARKLRGDP